MLASTPPAPHQRARDRVPGASRPPGDGSGAAPDHEDTVAEAPAWLACRACGHRVVRADDARLVDGSHEHTFVNPHGLVFTIACFASAPGIVADGSPSSEWTWFAGMTWQIALCGGCAGHLGWTFASPSEGFVGLASDRLRPDDGRPQG